MALVLTERLSMDNTTVHDVVAMGRYPYTSFLGGLSEQDERIIAESLEQVGFLTPSLEGRVGERFFKIPAAWLIEQCGWKGKTLGGAQVWPKQPLVIVNANNATPEDIIALAAQVSASVKEKFGIDIHPEVNYI